LEGIRRELQDNPDRDVSVVYRRDGEVITRSAAPERQSDGTGRLGVVFETDLGPRESEGTLGAFVFAWDVNRELLQQYGTFVRKIVTGDEEARSQVNTVVGIGARFDDEVRETPDLLLSLLGFMASLSFALALFNLIPILPLDGGHILFALIEKVRGSPVSRAAYERASIVGLVAMLLLFVLVLQNDVTLITGDGVVNQP
jgi:regulator of sigma E protease